jgi:hypothetical protein
MEARVPLTRCRKSAWLVLVGMCLTPVAQAQTVSKDACIDANEAAQKLKREGALSQARAKLQLCLRPECPGPVRADCAELSAAVDAAMPTIVFDAHDARGVRLVNVRVTMDHQPLAEQLDGTPLAVDPGSHAFEFTAPGQPSTSEHLYFESGEKRQMRVDLVNKTGPLLIRVGIGAGVVGAVAVSLGAYWGLQAKSTYDDAKAQCPDGPSSCNVQGIVGGQDAHDQASRSTVAFALGGVLLAGGATMYWLGSKMSVAPMTTGHADGGLAVSGVW